MCMGGTFGRFANLTGAYGGTPLSCAPCKMVTARPTGQEFGSGRESAAMEAATCAALAAWIALVTENAGCVVIGGPTGGVTATTGVLAWLGPRNVLVAAGAGAESGGTTVADLPNTDEATLVAGGSIACANAAA